MHRATRFVALAAVLMLAAGACSSTKSAADACAEDKFGCVQLGAGEAIKIGALLAIVGDVAFLGKDSVTGAQIAIDELDGKVDGTPGKLLGRDVTIVQEDDGCSAEGGQKGATALVADTKIAGVIGTTCSSAALGVADKIFSDKGVTVISPSNTNPNLTADGTHQPFYFRTAHNDKIQGAVVADFVFTKLGLKTAATINDESPYADALAAVFRDNFTKLGGKITGQEAINSKDKDFKPVLRTLGAGKPEFLFFPNFNPACALITAQAKGIAGLETTKLGGADGCLEPAFLTTAGATASKGVYASGPDFAALKNESFYKDEFLPQYKALAGTDPTAAFHAHAFDAMKVLTAAIRSTAIVEGDTINIPRTALRDAVKATSGLKGLSGTISCTESGDCATSVTIAVYEAPNWPVEGGNPDSKSIYSDTKTLADV